MAGIGYLQNEDQKGRKKKSRKNAYSNLKVLFYFLYLNFIGIILFPDFQKKLSHKHFKSYMKKCAALSIPL